MARFVTFCGKNCQLFFTGEACRVTFFGVPVPPKPDEGVPVVVGKAYDFVLWLLPKVEPFPRSRRFNHRRATERARAGRVSHLDGGGLFEHQG